MITPVQLIAKARLFLGTPYEHQGRTLKGLDCVGYILRVCWDLGLTNFDVDGYSRTPSNAMMKRLLNQNCVKIDLCNADPGSLLHMAFGDQPRHLALVSSAGPNRIIHASSEHGKVVEQVFSEHLRRSVFGAYQLPGVDYGRRNC